jgi:hypothetical protein
VTSGGETVRVPGACVTPEFYQMLGIEPSAGPLLTPEDDRPAHRLRLSSRMGIGRAASPLYIFIYIWTGKAVGAEVLSTIVGFLCRVPSVRNEEIALFSQQMTFWRGVGFSRGDCISKPDHAQLKESCGGREGLRI